MREIIFDVETTGLSPNYGHRIVEIGAVEMIDLQCTGHIFHHYINPKRDIPAEVVKIHGIDNNTVADCPTFAHIADEWLDFIGDTANIVAHNARFDMLFLNAELKWAGYKPIAPERVVDSLALAKKRYPDQSNSLDALCHRLHIKVENRTLHGALVENRALHGALLDSKLLCEVYKKLRQ